MEKCEDYDVDFMCVKELTNFNDTDGRGALAQGQVANERLF